MDGVGVRTFVHQLKSPGRQCAVLEETLAGTQQHRDDVET